MLPDFKPNLCISHMRINLVSVHALITFASVFAAKPNYA